MYKPYKGYGKKETIQGVDCYIPPIGKVRDWQTGALKEVGVVSRSPKKKKQYWERMPLPKNFESRSKEEARKQRFNESHIDYELEEFRQDAWSKRLEGMWFMNNGTPTYITGLHYYYLQWIFVAASQNDGYPSFWESDRKFFYYLQHVLENPDCFGMLYVTKRRAGKTMKSVAFILEGITRTKHANGGIQSKTYEDAKDTVYKDGVVRAFNHLPDFFKPAHSPHMGKSLSFTSDDYSESLNGWINFAASTETAYDGKKLFRYVGDEIFKTKEVDVRERHEIILPTLEDINRKAYGKALYTSTVEEMEGRIENYVGFWKDSDPKDINEETNQTITKLYRYFLPADEAGERDIYGFCDVKKTRKQILAEREQRRDNPRIYNGWVRKFPLTIQEAFRVTAENRVYDSIRLIDRLEAISWRKDLYETGNFVWKDGEKDTEIEWQPSQEGRWKVLWKFVNESDLIRPHQNRPKPWNDAKYTIGCDPYSHGRTEDYRNSHGSFYVYKKFDYSNPDQSDIFIVEYCARPATSDIFFEDLIKTMYFFGCQALIENNRNNILDYIKYRGYELFAMRIKGRKEPGIPGSTKTIGDIVAFTESYIYNHLHKIYFPDLINDWLKFDPFNTTDFDRAMGAGYTLIADARYKLLLKKMGEQQLFDVNMFA